MYPIPTIPTKSGNRTFLLTRLRQFLRRQVQNGGRVRILVALIAVVGASALFWTSRDYTVVAPDWDGQVRGIAYNPSHLFRASDQLHVTPEHIDRDLAQLAHVTGHIRTYTVDGGMDKVPESPAATA